MNYLIAGLNFTVVLVCGIRLVQAFSGAPHWSDLVLMVCITLFVSLFIYRLKLISKE